MQLLGLCGSLRARSSNLSLLRTAASLTPGGVELILYDGLGALPHFNPDLDGEGQTPPPAVARLRGLVARSAGLVISTPEYAHGLPGAFKNALDWLVSFPDFAGMPVLVLNAAAWGGEHAHASLLEILKTMSARVIADSRVTPFLRNKLDERTPLDDPAAAVVRASLAALVAAATQTQT